MSSYATCRIVYAKEKPAGAEDTGGGADGDNRLEISQLTEVEPYDHCQNDDRRLEIELEVIKSPDTITYDISPTYGTITGPVVAEREKQETVEIEGKSSYQLPRHVGDDLQCSWEGEIFDEAGRVDGAVAIRRQGQLLDFGRYIWGTLRLIYHYTPETYTLRLLPRNEGQFDSGDFASAYHSTVRLLWDQEPVTLEIDVDGLKRCPYDTMQVDPDEDDERCYHHIIEVDPCTKEVLREWDEVVPCEE